MASTRAALQCLAQVEILSGGWNFGVVNTLRVISAGTPPGVVTLRRSDNAPILLLRVLLDYQVMLDPNAAGRSVYRAEIVRYMYVVQDLTGRELFAYHFHPQGWSNVWTPHLHISAAQNVPLPARPERQLTTILALAKLHFPTHRVELPEFVRFLIGELDVAPRRQDWETVLDGLRR